MSGRLRVLFVESSQGGVTGGSLTGLMPLFASLPARGIETTLVLHEPKRVVSEIERFGVSVLVVPRHKLPKEHPLQGRQAYEKAKEVAQVAAGLRLARAYLTFARETLPSAIRLSRVMRRHQPHVVHLSNGFRTNADGIIAARLAGLPAICHVKAFEKYGPVERRVARLVRVGVCMSQAVLRHCQSAGVLAQTMRVIYDSLDPASFVPSRPREAIRQELGICESWPVIAVLGNIQEWKGQHVAVEATEVLARRMPRIACLVIGGVRRRSEEYAQALRQRVAEARLEAHVRFLGERSDVADLLDASDLLLHTSVRDEPFGRVALEAMAVAKPVVAARAGGMLEIVEEGRTGVLYQPGDALACAAAIGNLCADRARMAEMGKRGRMRLMERFAVATQVGTLAELYEETASNGKPRGTGGYGQE